MILVFGKSGQVATELSQFPNVICLGRDDCDLEIPEKCCAAILRIKPSAVINAAGYTAVDLAETEVEKATRLNADAPTEMARCCAALDIPFVHISTDYVFDGSGDRPWRTCDATAPQNAYGRSKLAGEICIRNSGAVHVILRTSWVVSAHGRNFIKTMLRLSETRAALDVVGDQIGGPTPAHDIAAACLQIVDQLIADPSKSGTYHLSGAPDVSWADLATEIFEQAGKGVTVTPIPTTNYPTPAKRPLNSRMDCSAMKKVFGIARPDWRNSLKMILQYLEVT